MMQDDREEILRALGAAESAVQLPPAPPLMRVASELPPAFMRAAAANQCAVQAVHTAAEVPAQVAAFLQQQGAPLQVVCEDALLQLPWAAAQVQAVQRRATPQDTCGVTGVTGAAADTGVMLLADDIPNRLHLSLLPPYHIAVVSASAIVADVAQLWQLLPQPLPRGTVLIGGPSRTADIEQTLTLGVHGPLAVLVVVVGDT